MDTLSSQTKQKINFSELMNRLLGLLTTKEQNIIERRFLFPNSEKETLEKIGKSYSITRERVRQIEAVAIKKLARISVDPSMRFIHDMAYSVLVSHGKVMSEDLLVSEMIKSLGNTKDIDANAMKLAMKVSDKLVKQEKNQIFRPFWYTKDLSIADIKNIISSINKELERRAEVVLLNDLQSALPKFAPEVIESALYINWNFMSTDEGWGLKTWRTVNPRSIKDKIFITLKNQEKPLHFTEIARHVLNDFNAKKRATPQAIHNELIRHDEFVLVGRGMFGLKEWGMAAGTVCEVIKSVLVENKKPMKRQEIIEAVLKKRDIRIGTISLNLQKYNFFKRVGRAVYEYDKLLDTKRRKRGQ